MRLFNTTLFSILVSLVLISSVSAKTDPVFNPLDKFEWTYDTDPHGSEAIINNKLIIHGGIWIYFKRVARVDEAHKTWVELIHKVPANSLAGINKIRIIYQCDSPLTMKLPQTEYGKKGDESRAYYQVDLPASKQWVSKEIDITDFARPAWTPKTSKDIKLSLEDIKEIYISPAFTDKEGGEAIIQVRTLELLP